MAVRKSSKGGLGSTQIKKLNNIYSNINNPASFGTVDALYREAKRRKLKVTRKIVSDFLSKQLSYTLHKPTRNRFRRNKTRAMYIDEVWQMDLCETHMLKKYNDGDKYILTMIDVFSKMAFAKSLPNKKGPTVLEAFLSVLEEQDRKPQNVHTDQGVEFTNRSFKSALKKLDIHYYVTFSETKASVVERFNKTLKTKMWKYFTHNNTYRYVDVLQDLVDGYNATPHGGISLAPVKVTEKNQLKVWRQSYKEPVNGKPFKYQVGEKVRISRDKRMFEKGYIQNWSEEHFIIEKRLRRLPHVYCLKDLDGEVLKGVFYEQQLQRVTPPDVFPIDNVIKKSKDKAYVKWRGWPEKFNSWVPIADIKQI